MAVTVVGTRLPVGEVGLSYGGFVDGEGGLPPYTFQFVSGDWPPGLEPSFIGSVNGIPTLAGSYTFLVRATDNALPPKTGEANLTIVINERTTPVAALALALSQDPPVEGKVGTFYSVMAIATDGSTPYSYSATGLPTGLSIDPSTGVIGGSPTAAGSFSATITVTDAALATASLSKTFVITESNTGGGDTGGTTGGNGLPSGSVIETTKRVVPVQTPMYTEDMKEGQPIKHLTRTWEIFFEQVGMSRDDYEQAFWELGVAAGGGGETGAAATVEVGSTTTGEPGTNAQVTNSGTPSAAVLDFVIPKGEKGDKGDAGTAGQDGAPGLPGYSPNMILSGGYVAWIDDHRYRVSACVYIIGGVQYSSAETEVVLSTPDTTNDRIDLIAVDDTGTVVVITGTPSGAPARPDVDPATQLGLTFAIVPANSTVPPNVTVTDVYHENTEWTSSVSANINAASTNNPHGGTKCVEATSAATGNYIQFAAASPEDLSARNNLIFYIRSKAAWASKRQVQLYFANAGVRVGSIVVLNENAFGFVSSNTTAYQQIIIPLSLFAVNGTVQQLRIQVAGSQGAIGFYLDDITLQGGVTPPVAVAGLAWRGTYNSTATYVANDVVKSSGLWVALRDSTGVTPAEGAYWALMAAESTGGGTPSSTVASLDGTGAAGTSTDYSRGDHKHADAARHTHANKTTLDAVEEAYTTAEKTKLAGIAPGAEVNVQADWNAESGDAAILNKPTIPGAPVRTLGATLYTVGDTWFTPPLPYSGTLVAWSITVDAGTATIKVWRVASGTARPTATDSINTAGISISSGTTIRSADLSDFGANTSFALHDQLAFHFEAASGAAEVTVALEVQP